MFFFHSKSYLLNLYLEKENHVMRAIELKEIFDMTGWIVDLKDDRLLIP